MSMKQNARSKVMIIAVQKYFDISPKNNPYEPLKTDMFASLLVIFTRYVEARVRRSYKQRETLKISCSHNKR